MDNIIPFQKKEVQDYLDRCIKYWRNQKEQSEDDTIFDVVSSCYIDAYQSVRISLFGETLK